MHRYRTDSDGSLLGGLIIVIFLIPFLIFFTGCSDGGGGVGPDADDGEDDSIGHNNVTVEAVNTENGNLVEEAIFINLDGSQDGIPDTLDATSAGKVTLSGRVDTTMNLRVESPNHTSQTEIIPFSNEGTIQTELRPANKSTFDFNREPFTIDDRSPHFFVDGNEQRKRALFSVSEIPDSNELLDAFRVEFRVRVLLNKETTMDGFGMEIEYAPIDLASSRESKSITSAITGDKERDYAGLEDKGEEWRYLYSPPIDIDDANSEIKLSEAEGFRVLMVHGKEIRNEPKSDGNDVILVLDDTPTDAEDGLVWYMDMIVYTERSD